MYGDAITSAYDELWQIDVPAVQVTDTQQDVSNEQTLPEKITLEGFRSSSTSLFTHTVVCSVHTV
jgi:hypothetical protein